MHLSEHFTLAELTASDYALRHGLNNMPVDHEVLANLHALAAGLERVRAIFGLPVIVNSAYRSPKTNAGIGGHPRSFHVRGLAADIVIPGVSARDAALEISRHDLGIDQLICEGTWVHVGWPEPEDAPRGEILTAIFKPGKPVGYVKGIA